MEVEGFFRTRGFIHKVLELALELVFRWGNAGTLEGIWMLVINIERIWGGVMTFKWNIRNSNNAARFLVTR